MQLTRDRVLEMMDNFAKGQYQAISPETVAEAARHLRESEPKAEQNADHRQAASPWQPMTDAVDIAHLGKLGEECGELVGIIFRCLIQGIDEVEPTTKKVNRKALQDEIADVLAMSDMAIARFQLDNLEIEQRIDRKKAMKREWHELIKAGAVTAFGVLREIAAQSDGNWAIEMANQWLNRIKGTTTEAQPWRDLK